MALADSTDSRPGPSPLPAPENIAGFANTADATTPAAPAPPASPMLAQYLEIKRAHPDCLLFYRMGDFYEMFFEDAVAAAGALNITLTRRGRHEGDDIPMCGVPVHSHDAYLSRLIRQGFRVAICEQIEDPAESRKRGSKSVVRRAVIRIVTPGTLTEDSLLDARANNHLAAVADANGALGLAWLDLSTGELSLQAVGVDQLPAALARLDPQELLIPERLAQRPALFDLLADWKPRLTVQPTARFNSDNGRERLQAAYQVGTLDAFGSFTRAEIAAAGAVVDYVELTQKGRMPRLMPPRRLAEGSAMEIDAATRRNLELTRTLGGDRAGSLLATIDRTVTGPGARLLAGWLSAPLADATAIAGRLDMVEFLVSDEPLRQGLRGLLRQTADMERALARLSLGRGGPRDLAAIRDTLTRVADIARALRALDHPAAGLAEAAAEMGEHSALIDRLQRALAPELPLVSRDGGFIARGYAAALDELVGLRDDSRRLIAGLQNDYQVRSGVTTLKIRHNNVIGYYIEVTPAHADKLMVRSADNPFIHRQTMANAVRFTTVELGELERRISEAGDRALALELALFDDLVGEIAGRGDVIGRAARALSTIDVVAALAEIAGERRWCRPELDKERDFRIEGGRHPVVEAALQAADGGPFVANDCDLSDTQRLWLLTGPNMAGKSTFLRQNAVITILAQVGSFVPAERARIGIVDRLFSRVGAADDLARGRSTFMVEMVETAAILNQAGPRSLVILDEIGRGTATFDGLSIAWACVEHLHTVTRCRALFATHYHELTALATKLPALSCHTMRVKEWHGDVVFLHEVAAGAADRSYGIHVARLAGLPAPVLKRAEHVLRTLESGQQSNSIANLAEDLPLFTAALRHTPPAESAPVVVPETTAAPALEAALRDLNPDDLTPRQALEALYRLRNLL